MKDRIRTLALVTLGLSLVACSEKSPPQAAKTPQATATATKSHEPGDALDDKKKKPKESVLEAAKPKATSTSFTSTAPAKSSSVLDAAPKPVRPLPERVTKAASDGMPDVDDAGEEKELDLDPSQVKIVRFVLASDVQGREPVDEAEVFTTETPKIFAFLHFDNQGGEPYAVKVHFEPADGPALPYGIDLDVGPGPRWRTWAYTQVRREPGTYRAVVRTPEGEDIASRTFEIVTAE